MKERLALDVSGAQAFLEEASFRTLLKEAEDARQLLMSGKGAGSEFTDWVDLPENYDREEFARIEAAAGKISADSDVLVVIGIGGSYLGARAAIEFLSHSFMNLLDRKERKAPQIFFAGNSISTDYLADLLDVIGDRDFSLNIISKSGTTTEPAIAFRVLKKKLEEKYGREEAAKRIYATTDRKKGALKALADEEGYECFVVPDGIGGRYSVLTAVGLLPIAAAGCDIRALMEGAAAMREDCKADPCASGVLEYAAARNLLYRRGRSVEILSDFEPSLHYVAEWWKQLYGESEGKGHKGIFPAAVDLTTDLHSMGQFIQDGTRLMFETVLEVKETKRSLFLEEEAVDTDGLNYLAGKSIAFVNGCALEGSMKAHQDGGVPVLRLVIPRRDAFSLGQLFYFLEFACGVSGYMLGVNPFDQPGVESYKKNMFTLLGKPGFVQK